MYIWRHSAKKSLSRSHEWSSALHCIAVRQQPRGKSRARPLISMKSYCLCSVVNSSEIAIMCKEKEQCMQPFTSKDASTYLRKVTVFQLQVLKIVRAQCSLLFLGACEGTRQLQRSLSTCMVCYKYQHNTWEGKFAAMHVLSLPSGSLPLRMNGPPLVYSCLTEPTPHSVLECFSMNNWLEWYFWPATFIQYINSSCAPKCALICHGRWDWE